MFSWFQWTETTPAAAGTACSTGTVTNTDPGSAAGILSSSNLDEAEMLTIVFEGPGATGGTLDVYVQTFLDAHWYDLCHIKQLANGAVATKLQYICGRANQQTGTVVGIDRSPCSRERHHRGRSLGSRVPARVRGGRRHVGRRRHQGDDGRPAHRGTPSDDRCPLRRCARGGIRHRRRHDPRCTVTWRTGHGTGAGSPPIEVLPADEQPTRVPAPEPVEAAQLQRTPNGRFTKDSAKVAGAKGGATPRKKPTAMKLAKQFGLGRLIERWKVDDGIEKFIVESEQWFVQT